VHGEPGLVGGHRQQRRDQHHRDAAKAAASSAERLERNGRHHQQGRLPAQEGRARRQPGRPPPPSPRHRDVREQHERDEEDLHVVARGRMLGEAARGQQREGGDVTGRGAARQQRRQFGGQRHRHRGERDADDARGEHVVHSEATPRRDCRGGDEHAELVLGVDVGDVGRHARGRALGQIEVELVVAGQRAMDGIEPPAGRHRHEGPQDEEGTAHRGPVNAGGDFAPQLPLGRRGRWPCC